MRIDPATFSPNISAIFRRTKACADWACSVVARSEERRGSRSGVFFRLRPPAVEDENRSGDFLAEHLGDFPADEGMRRLGLLGGGEIGRASWFPLGRLFPPPPPRRRG